ncbi:tetratricopeptide repeat protein [Streptomyces sp. NPDC092369]|uniref:tetratricopeptide repeat protein n=1 Tax=Streptomyces sp. NPDC092369 TaxID=3366015 RepID=UPI003807E2E6
MKQPPEETTQFVFHVRGPGGVGKSTLLRQMEGAARETHAITTYVDESVSDALEAMESISGQLAQHGLTLKNFDKRLVTYRQRRHEAHATAAAAAATQAAGEIPPFSSHGAEGSSPSPSTVVASQLGLVGLGMIPGVGAFVGAVDPQQVAAGASHLRAILSSRFNSHDDVKLVLSPLQELTPIFLADLSEVAQRQSWLVLSFDTFERIGPLLNSWLRDLLLSDRYGEIPANVIAIIAGQSDLEESYWGDFRDLITDMPLDVFTDKEARQLLAVKGVTDERVIEVILQLSRRLPVLVSTLAESHPSSAEEVGDPSDTAVERFLKWETDPARRSVAIACALPQELDEDVYRAAVDEGSAGLFDWLKAMPFVTYRAGRCRYHDVVRAAMLRLQRQQSLSRWQEQQGNLADSFRQRRVQWEQAHSSAKRSNWGDAVWRNLQIQEIYHLLCAKPQTEFIGALRLLIYAYEHSVKTARRCAETIAQAGNDSGEKTLSEWGQKFLCALEAESLVRTQSLSLLLARGDLDAEGRSIVYTLRGRYQFKSENYDQALNEYSAALKLNPNAQLAYFGRGQAYQLMLRPDDALADFNRAIELDPESVRALIGRGLVYLTGGQLEAALADFDGAIEITPGSISAHRARGLVHQQMRQFTEALIDYDRAIDLDPNSVWTYARRADTYQSLGRNEEALADFSRAIEIDPDSVKSLISRGMIRNILGNFDEAVVDFNRAISLDPDHAFAHTGRGLAYGSLGKGDEALLDYNRAVELDPGSASILTSRGLSHQLERRFEDALADYDRALDLDPDNVWARTNRGLVHHFMDQYTEALRDFDRAIEIRPDDAWAYASRGDSLHCMERFDDALVDYNRAIEIKPDDTRVLLSRGLTYFGKDMLEFAISDYSRVIELESENARALNCRALAYSAMGQFADALSDHDRAFELDPNSSWIISSRAETYDIMGDYRRALADHDRAILIDPENALALASRGDTHRYLGQYDAAVSDYSRSIQIDSDRARSYSKRCFIYRLRGRYEDALADCNRALDLDPESGWSFTNRGLIYRLMGQYEKALADHNRAIALAPRSSWAHYERSVVLYALLHPDRKRQVIRTVKVIAAEADTPSSKGNMFLSACLMLRWQKAEDSFSGFVSSDPAPGEIGELLAAIDSLAQAVPARKERLLEFRRRLETYRS